MRNILGHISRNEREIAEILAKGGSYTYPTLPHYRYQRVQSICWAMRSLGLARKSGKCETGVNIVKTEKFDEWFKSGRTLREQEKLHKKLNPRKPKTKKYCHCGAEFQTLNYPQKFCSKICKSQRNFTNQPPTNNKENV